MLRRSLVLLVALLALGSAAIGVSALSVAGSGEDPAVEIAEGVIAILCALGLATYAARAFRR